MGLWSNSSGPMTGMSFRPGMPMLAMVVICFRSEPVPK